MLAAGTTEADQHRAADVMAPLNRDAPDRLRHPLIGNRQGPLSQPFQSQRLCLRGPLAQGCRQRLEALPHHDHIGALVSLGAEHRWQRSLGQTAQQQVGVGDGQRTAAAVTGRTGIGAGGLGAHQQPLAIGPQQRAPSGGHRVDRQHRRLHLQPGNRRDRRALPGVLAPGAIEMEDIGGGAAHVEAENRPIATARRLGRGHRCHHAAGRAGEDRVLGLQLDGRLQSAAGGHHPQPGRLPQGDGHLGQIALQAGPHRRFHHRRLQPGHEPALAAELMGEQHRTEAKLLEPAAQGQLMGRMAVAVQQGNGDAVIAIGAGLAQLAFQIAPQAQGHQLGTIGSQAPLHLEHPHRQGLGSLDPQGEDVRAMLIADGGQIGETTVEQQQHRLQLPLQQGIGGHGGAETHLRHQTRRQGLIGGQPQHLSQGPDRRITGPLRLHRQHLAHHQPPRGRSPHQIGEGAAPIDPEAPATSSSSTTSRSRSPGLRPGCGLGCGLGPAPGNVSRCDASLLAWPVA